MRFRNHLLRTLTFFVAGAVLLGGLTIGGCALLDWQDLTAPLVAPTTEPTPIERVLLPKPSPTPTDPEAVTPVEVEEIEPTPLPLVIGIDDGIPAELRAAIAAWAADLPGATTITIDPSAPAGEGEATTVLIARQELPDSQLLYERVLVPAVQFPGQRDEAEASDLLALWQGEESSTFSQLLISENSATLLRALWGAPGEQITPLADTEAVLAAAWEDRQAVSIVPFERLNPRWRALRLDGQIPTDNRFDASEWPLTLRVYAGGASEPVDELVAAVAEQIPITNRDPDRLTVLVMTGVTAMARLTAHRMEQHQDYAHPARVIGAELAAADITHISNEVPFMEGCQVNITRNNVVFCSKPEYVATLHAVGANIVGLTGNHQNDFGPDVFRWTLDFYEQEGLKYFGGGRNDAEARAPLIIEHNGNRLAFLGANAWGPQFAWAREDFPGSARYDRQTMLADIDSVREEVDLVFAELQYIEDYTHVPLPGQYEDFRALSQGGADVVTGVQAHQPQAIEFPQHRGIILYGLGNLFFDQMWSWETRTSLIPRHTIYAGRLLHTELLTTVIEDYAQPRWATPEERERILRAVFAASGW